MTITKSADSGLIEYVFANTPRRPKWFRTFFHDPVTGEVYVPDACVRMSPTEALLCAGFDGIGIVQLFNHIYVPVSWARKQTDNAEALRVIEVFASAAKQLKSE